MSRRAVWCAADVMLPFPVSWKTRRASTLMSRTPSLPYLVDARLELGHICHVPSLSAFDLEQALRRHLEPVLAVALVHQRLLVL